MAVASRSVYVSRLRRAFLLQAHPDRFRSSQIQRQQAELVQAISDRMTRPDFLSYTYGSERPQGNNNNYDRMARGSYPSLSFVLEKKDGTLDKHTLDLNTDAEGVLSSMADALRKTGLASLPPPPKAPKPNELNPKTTTTGGSIDWAKSSSRNSSTSTTKSSIDHQYDVNSNRGRDLQYFLSSVDSAEIERRKAARMDVVAAASVLRRDYGFSAVDGTGLGWSSQSLAILLHSLVHLYHEHSDKFAIQSFYPLVLMWSSEDQPLDIYGGILYLNPASTPIQWMEHLLNVTPETVLLHKHHRAILTEASRYVNRALDVKFQKGHSCSSKDYYELMVRLKDSLSQNSIIPFDESASTLTLQRVHVVVESPLACRRPILTKDGIRVSSNMSNKTVIVAVAKLLTDARDQLRQAHEDKQMEKDMVTRTLQDLGVASVQKGKIVQVYQFVEALVRLSQLGEKHHFVGTSIGIVGSGHFCHLGDDGALMIPWDWK